MIHPKKIIFRLFFMGEILAFSFLYIFGDHGLQALHKAERENHAIRQHITQLKDEIRALQNEIRDWHSYPFFKEKVAREQLQMAHPHDMVYAIIKS